MDSIKVFFITYYVVTLKEHFIFKKKVRFLLFESKF